MHAQSEGGSVQREILEHSPGKCEKTSQKPSQVCGVNSVNGRNRAVDVRDGSRGLITPAAHQKYPCGNRCQKIRRLVKEFQKKRQIQLGLKQQRDYNDNNLQQNSRSHLDDARPSIERLFDISSTSESSAYEFGADKPDGVHTNGGNSERNHNGRNAKIESRSNLFSTSAGGGKKQRSRERHNARYAGIPHSGETSNLKKEQYSRKASAAHQSYSDTRTRNAGGQTERNFNVGNKKKQRPCERPARKRLWESKVHGRP